MKIKFSEESCAILEYSRDEAMRTGSYGVGTEHVLLGILRHADNCACRALSGSGIDISELKRSIDDAVFQESPVPYCDRDAVKMTKAAGRMVALAGLEALRCGTDTVCPSHLLLAISRGTDSKAGTLLYEEGVDYDILHSFLSAHGMLSDRTGIRTPSTEEMLGPLGEQLTALYGTVRDRTNIYS